MNIALYDKIIESIEDQKNDRKDMDFVIDEIKNDPKKSSSSVEQIILKAIKHNTKIPR